MPNKRPGNDEDLMPIRTPRFRSEAEEAAWWDKNLDRILEEGLDRLRSKQTLKAVTMRLPEGDMALARTIAAKRGLHYQTYLKTIIHSALQTEAKKMLNGRK
jgi:predicted DNA binding CopG/RHH family protein